MNGASLVEGLGEGWREEEKGLDEGAKLCMIFMLECVWLVKKGWW